MAETNLTQQEAADRAAHLAVDSYDVTLDLTTGDQTFRTTSKVHFTSTSPGSETFIDFIGESVESITLNGTSLDPATAFAGARITLPDLAANNELVIDATGRYMNTGEGLHRFVDPTDDEAYLYTQFEVADSRRMFPVFEQPDLKASFTFTVTAPDHWQLVSNSPTPEPSPAQDGAATWAFPATERISSYITALVAGPYDVVRDQVETGGGTIPLALYVRKSLREFLDAENVFDCTKRGFAFFEEQFGLAYPFAKYDQIFTPEYNAGAMENAACVTINELYVFRAKVSDAIVERRGLTILHELAHMWFGDLVTMKWWNDLWLNESFAEWASTTAQAEATQWTDAWTTFSTLEKSWAYAQDQLQSTHPIVAQIRDLEDVETNFDGITYAKGASVLKQLVAYVGRDAFVAGLQSYFAGHAWGNTTLADLLAELEKTSGRDLQSWVEKWLQTAGVNTLQPDVDYDANGTITKASISQTFDPSYPTLRPHRLAVGVYALQGDSFVRVKRVELDVDGESTQVPDLVGVRGDVVLVNDDDLTYAKIRLDERSLRAVLDNPVAWADSLPRALVNGALWDMTRDAQIRARDFVSVLLQTLPLERESALLRMQLAQLATCARLYVARDYREQLSDDAAAALRAMVMSAEPGSDAQLQLMQSFAAYAHRGPDVQFIRSVLDGSTEIAGLAVDTEMRWTLLISLASAGAIGTEEIDAELERDNTSTGQERAARARAALPTADAKADAWTKLVSQLDLPNQTISAVGDGFSQVHDTALLEPYVDKYHAMLEGMWGERTFHIGQQIATLAYPFVLADQRLLDTTNAWLEEHPDASSGLRRVVSENRDTVARAVAAQARDAS